MDGSYRLPNLQFTEEENSRLTEILTDFDTYANEMVYNFIMGQEPLDNFDQYIEGCKSMGIEEAISIYQAAYDRYMSK